MTLRPPALNDAGAVDDWLGEALAAVAGSAVVAAPTSLAGVRQSLRKEQRLWLIAIGSAEPVGLMIITALSGDVARIDTLAIRSDRRNLGLGAEAVYALEDLQPATKLLAGVPADNGLAIYFWLRIGYAPLFPRPPASILPPHLLYMTRGGEAAAADV